MQISAILVAALLVVGAVADLHPYANRFSHIEPIGQDHSCPSKRDMSAILRGLVVKHDYADACNAYEARNTGSNTWDSCPDCTLFKRHTVTTGYCGLACNSAAKHIGGDEFDYYCKQFGADGLYGY